MTQDIKKVNLKYLKMNTQRYVMLLIQCLEKKFNL